NIDNVSQSGILVFPDHHVSCCITRRSELAFWSTQLPTEGRNGLFQPGPTNPISQQNSAMGAPIKGESITSSTPPNPLSQVLESLLSISRLNSDSARSPIIPAIATSNPYVIQ